MPPRVQQPPANPFAQLFAPNNPGPNNQGQGGNNQQAAQPFGVDNFLAAAGNLLGQAQEVINDPRAQAMAAVAAENQDLAALLVRIGLAPNPDIRQINRHDLELIVNNLDLLQRSGLLNAVRNDINNPRFDAFLALRRENPEVADQLARFFVRVITKEDFGINDITADETRLILNNLDLMERTGLLRAIENDLPDEVKEALRFRQNNPLLCRAVLNIGQRFPWLIDCGLGIGRFISSAPVQNFINRVSSTISNIGTFCSNVLSRAEALVQRAGDCAVNVINAVGNFCGNVINAIKFW